MLPSSSSPTLPTVFFEAQDYLNLAFFKEISSKRYPREFLKKGNISYLFNYLVEK